MLESDNSASSSPLRSYPTVVRYAAYVLLLFIASGIFLKVCFPIESSNDVWWHLKTGQVLLEYWENNGFGFPEHDLFSLSGENLPWANHEWLADVLMFLLWQSVGPMGFIVAKSLFVILTYLFLFWLIYRRAKFHLLSDSLNGDSDDADLTLWLVASLGTIVAFMASQYTMYLRPPVLTYFFIAMTLHLMLNLEQKGKGWRQASFWILPALMVVWVNLHGGAILGIVLSGLIAAGLFFEALHTRLVKKQPVEIKTISVWMALTLVMLVASLINPFGYDILALTLKIMKDVTLIHTIGELQSPNFHFTQYYELLIVAFFLLLSMGRRLRFGSVLLVLFFLHQSLNHVRHLPVFALIVSPILFSQIAVWIHERRGKIMRMSQVVVMALTLFVTSRAIFEGYQIEFVRFLRHRGVVEEAYPVEAVNFVEYKRPPGPMFNSINFAGYLIWRLSPEQYKVFTDSRFDIHGSRAMAEVLAVEDVDRRPAEQALWMQGLEVPVSSAAKKKPYWRYILDKHGIQFLIVSSESRLALYLDDGRKGWKPTFLQPPTIADGRKFTGYTVFLRDNDYKGLE